MSTRVATSYSHALKGDATYVNTRGNQVLNFLIMRRIFGQDRIRLFRIKLLLQNGVYKNLNFLNIDVFFSSRHFLGPGPNFLKRTFDEIVFDNFPASGLCSLLRHKQKSSWFVIPSTLHCMRSLVSWNLRTCITEILATLSRFVTNSCFGYKTGTVNFSLQHRNILIVTE